MSTPIDRMRDALNVAPHNGDGLLALSWAGSGLTIGDLFDIVADLDKTERVAAEQRAALATVCAAAGLVDGAATAADVCDMLRAWRDAVHEEGIAREAAEKDAAEQRARADALARAKAENDERFMTERDEDRAALAKSEAGAAAMRGALTEARSAVSYGVADGCAPDDACDYCNRTVAQGCVADCEGRATLAMMDAALASDAGAALLADLQKARDSAETRRQALRDAINDIDRLHDEADASKAALDRAEGRVRALAGAARHIHNALRFGTVGDNERAELQHALDTLEADVPPTPAPPLDVEPRPPAEAGDDCVDADHLRLLADGVTGCRRCGRVVRWDVPAKEQAAEQVAARRFCSECGHWVEECECPRAVEDEEQAAGGGEGEET